MITQILKIFELCKGAKRSQYNFSFMNKIGGRSNNPTLAREAETWSPIVNPYFKITGRRVVPKNLRAFMKI